jgi:hypothetical protein
MDLKLKLIFKFLTIEGFCPFYQSSLVFFQGLSALSSFYSINFHTQFFNFQILHWRKGKCGIAAGPPSSCFSTLIGFSLGLYVFRLSTWVCGISATCICFWPSINLMQTRARHPYILYLEQRHVSVPLLALFR